MVILQQSRIGKQSKLYTRMPCEDTKKAGKTGARESMQTQGGCAIFAVLGGNVQLPMSEKAIHEGMIPYNGLGIHANTFTDRSKRKHHLAHPATSRSMLCHEMFLRFMLMPRLSSPP